MHRREFLAASVGGLVAGMVARSAFGSTASSEDDEAARRHDKERRFAQTTFGRIAYIDPSNQWGYLYGPVGERVYFHATVVLGEISQLELGALVCYRVADGGDQLCASRVAQ